MNKVKILLVLLFFCALTRAQNDTTRVNPPAPDTAAQKEVQPAPTPTVEPQQPPKSNRKRPKGYDDYVNKGKRPNTDVTPFMDKVYYGCNLQLGFSSVSGGGGALYYDLSPHAGYKFNEFLSIGVQVIYNNTTYTFGTQRINYNIFGTGIFGRVLVFNRLFLQGEVDALSIPANYLGNTIVSRRVSDEKMFGLGYKSPLGDKLGYFFVLMYDIQPNIYSPYFYNPLVYRAGLSWNF